SLNHFRGLPNAFPSKRSKASTSKRTDPATNLRSNSRHDRPEACPIGRACRSACQSTCQRGYRLTAKPVNRTLACFDQTGNAAVPIRGFQRGGRRFRRLDRLQLVDGGGFGGFRVDGIEEIRRQGLGRAFLLVEEV